MTQLKLNESSSPPLPVVVLLTPTEIPDDDSSV